MGGSEPGACTGSERSSAGGAFQDVPAKMDKKWESAASPIRCLAKLLPELVELMGIEPMTS